MIFLNNCIDLVEELDLVLRAGRFQRIGGAGLYLGSVTPGSDVNHNTCSEKIIVCRYVLKLLFRRLMTIRLEILPPFDKNQRSFYYCLMMSAWDNFTFLGKIS